MLAWTWNDRASGREVSRSIHRCWRLDEIDAAGFVDAGEEERVLPNCPRGGVEVKRVAGP